jgi:hypothetical protein
MLSTVKPRLNGGRILSYVDAEISAEPMPFDCEHIVDSNFGRLITMEE